MVTNIICLSLKLQDNHLYKTLNDIRILYVMFSLGLSPRTNVLFWGPNDFRVTTQTGISPLSPLEIVIQEV